MKKSAEYYKKNPESYAKKLAYDKKHNAKPEQRAKRAELVKVHSETVMVRMRHILRMVL